MTIQFKLDGSIVPRTAARHLDERGEPRADVRSQTAVLEFRGRRHVVRLLNVSPSGAMVIFSLIPNIGQTIRMQLFGRGQIGGQVCWVGDGKIGVTFAGPKE